MADKNYLDFLDIPNGNSTERWHTRDVEAQAGIAQVASAIGYDTDYEFVDLGLPSGTLWAKENCGVTEATSTQYFMYGKGSRKYTYGDAAYQGTENPLSASVDTATQMFGSPWHIPTKEQWEELIANTNYSNGTFTSKTDSTKYITLAMNGYYQGNTRYEIGSKLCYWTSTPDGASNAYGVVADVSDTPAVSAVSRQLGYCVRGVIDGSIFSQLKKKADKTELPVYATIATCQDIISELI